MEELDLALGLLDTCLILPPSLFITLSGGYSRGTRFAHHNLPQVRRVSSDENQGLTIVRSLQ